jgi:hypothetical protein
MPSQKAKWRKKFNEQNKQKRPRDDAKGKRLLETVKAISIFQV